VEVRSVDELNRLFKDKNEAWILGCLLADGPLRNSELVRALAREVPGQLGETQMNRCLRYLINQGRVERAQTGRITKYQLTEAGRADAEAIRDILGSVGEK